MNSKPSGLKYTPQTIIQDAYLKLKSQYLSATHIALGYCVIIDGEPVQGGCSDGEYQADFKLMDLLYKNNVQNIAVFVARWYGGVHIGGMRMTLLQQCAREVVDALSYLKIIPVPASPAPSKAGDADNDTTSGAESSADDEVETAPPKQAKKTQPKKTSTHGASHGGGHGRGRPKNPPRNQTANPKPKGRAKNPPCPKINVQYM